MIKEGANVAAVNNDGDLPIDICEDEVMEQMLQEEMGKLGKALTFDTCTKVTRNRQLKLIWDATMKFKLIKNVSK